MLSRRRPRLIPLYSLLSAAPDFVIFLAAGRA
jgi:hypothetical protein